MEQLLKRDELSELVGIPYNTLAVWRHKGYIASPNRQGATAKQSRYTIDEAFAVYCFALSREAPGLKLRDSAAITRYLQARPGTVELLYHYWLKPTNFKVYPTHDLAAFDIPESLFYDLTWRATREVFEAKDRFESQGIYGHKLVSKLEEELMSKTRLFSQLHDQHKRYGHYVRELESNSDPKLNRANTRGAFAGRIFRNAKHVQYQNSWQRRTYADWLDQMDLSDMTVEELLVAEAWALEYIDDALYQFGLDGPPDSEGSPNYIVDVTEALEKVVKAYGPPKSEARKLLEEENLDYI